LNEVTRYTGAGVAYRGLLSRRPADTFGLGLIRASFASLNPETAIELFYKLQLTDKLRIQPDIQWVRNPASQGRNALAAGLRVGLDF
jgi:porin